MKNIEKDAEKKVRNNVNTSTEQTLDSLKDIMSDGAKKFEQSVGRPMTYAEMRMMFG